MATLRHPRPAVLARDIRAMAMTEFGLVLPVLVLLSCYGLELANYVITKMQVSQVALQIADNASRMGDAVQGVKTVSEANIAETFIGGQLQAGRLDLQNKGRIIVSSLEPMTNPNSTSAPRFRIRWQRCSGVLTNASSYGLQGATDLVGMGPADRQVTAQDYEATMFVEVVYRYTPLFSADYVPNATIKEFATMAVRDPRTLGVVPTSTGTAATC
ncbi:pilus assembly protein [uncultured Sphingomonas sp.]|uniref:pilus assembly protein n=1 Tax=uncultured Sphingomonas sp. TaxID=158754 RepID=UPI0035C986CA